MVPGVALGLSDHTPGHATVLGAVALGARVIEKHFTDDNQRIGPDHAFSMVPTSWKEMVVRTRELEAALGTGVKQVEANEMETVVLQRRAFYFTRDAASGERITADIIHALRPAPRDAVPLNHETEIIGRCLSRDVQQGDCLKWHHLA